MNETWRQAVERAMNGAPDEARAAWKRLMEQETRILAGAPEHILRDNPQRADELISAFAGKAPPHLPEVTLATNPYDPCVMDREQLVSALFQARGEMVSNHKRAEEWQKDAWAELVATRAQLLRAKERGAEMDSLSARLEQMRGRWVEAQKEIYDAKIERDSLTARLERRATAARDFQAQLIEREAEVASLTARLEQMRGRANEAESELRTLRAVVAQANGQALRGDPS